MPDIRAIANGNWSNPAIWAPNPPAAGDVVRPNNFTVTIDVNVTVTEIRNDAGGGAVVGGSFTLNDGVTVTASNGFFGTYASAAIGLLNYNGAGIVTLNGNIDGSRNITTNTCAVSNNSSGTIIINGNLTSAGSGGSSQTLRNQSNGTLIINGNLTSVSGELIRNGAGTTTITGNITTNSGSAITNASGTVTITGDLLIGGPGNTQCVSQTGTGIVNVIGNLFAGGAGNTISTNTCINNTSSGTVNVTGNLTGGSVTSTGAISLSACILNSGTGTVNVTGTVTNGSSQAGASNLAFLQAIRNTSTGIINIIGNCVGTIAASAANQSAALVNAGTGNCNITGNAIGGSTGCAIQNVSTGTLTLNGNAIGGTAYQAIEGVNAAGNTIVEKIRFGANGQTATRGYIKFKNTPNIAAETVLKTDATTTNLVDINVVPNLQPSVTNVRLGVTYSSGSLTGTMNVPPFNAVKAGVPVDNGVGTAALTPQDVWNVLISGLTQSGSIGERLKNVATVETTGTQIASFNV